MNKILIKLSLDPGSGYTKLNSSFYTFVAMIHINHFSLATYWQGKLIESPSCNVKTTAPHRLAAESAVFVVVLSKSRSQVWTE